MENLILLNKNDLREILQEMLPSVVVETSKEIKDYLRFDEGLSYLNERGLNISFSTLYKRTAEKKIPFQRWGGRKIIFVREELDGWIEDQLSRKRSNDVTKKIAESARRKERRS